MKAFRAEVLEGLHLRHDWHRFCGARACAGCKTVTEIDIDLHPEERAGSEVRWWRRILVGLLDLVSVWFLLIFSRKPLLFGGTGLVSPCSVCS